MNKESREGKEGSSQNTGDEREVVRLGSERGYFVSSAAGGGGGGDGSPLARSAHSRTPSPLDDGRRRRRRRRHCLDREIEGLKGPSLARIMSCIMIGILMILASIARNCAGCPFCARQQPSEQQQQQQLYRTIGSPRPFGADKPTRVQEFNRTGVLHPEYQIPATIRPGNVSQ